LANELQSGIEVTRTAKTRGGVVATLLVCLSLCFAAKPQLGRAFMRHLFGGNSYPASRSTPKPRMAELPNLFFWAWERTEDLRFLESKNAGVAFLAKTIYVPAIDEDGHNDVGGSLFVRPRLQPLRIGPGTPLIAVVRIETRAGKRLQPFTANDRRTSTHQTFTSLQLQHIVDEIVDLQNLSNIRAIQIDFDATVSERASYAQLLEDVRHRLPTSLPLSITALASWCIGDPWLAQLPPGTIDEAVPMLFRMGPDSSDVAKFIRSGEDFRVSACQSSLGLSTDEPLSNALLRATLPVARGGLSHSKRIYVFAPHAWTQTDAEAVLKEWRP
jgi:Protein of unknown function (DUF3142)